jgi:PadR family transcriptional regulator, regulatory protein AphA
LPAAEEADIRLTTTSYIVLGMLLEEGEATPYDLKAKCTEGIGNLWSLQHTQLYAEPERLAGAGYLTETQEEGGRRRKLYRITDAGRTAFAQWLADGPTDDLPEIRDINLLKVYFGADPVPFAKRQAEAHRAKLHEYQELARTHDLSGMPGKAVALRGGMRYEQQFITFWESLAAGEDT